MWDFRWWLAGWIEWISRAICVRLRFQHRVPDEAIEWAREQARGIDFNVSGGRPMSEMRKEMERRLSEITDAD